MTKTEDQHIEDNFLQTFGQIVIDYRERTGEETMALEGFDFDMLRRFHRAGWVMGKSYRDYEMVAR